jgi:AcrR family transcriptional regulator
MKRRAEAEARTRLRITVSAVELHGTLGPARTSISAIAERAGVRRSTVYRHFPDEAALFGACSAHWIEANPLPDMASWPTIADPQARLRFALCELYAFYRRTASMMEHLLRDEPAVPVLTRLLGGYRAYLAAARETLIAGRDLRGGAQRRTRAAIGHALAFHTWRSLALEQGLGDRQAAELMCRLAEAARATGDDRAGRAGRDAYRRAAGVGTKRSPATEGARHARGDARPRPEADPVPERGVRKGARARSRVGAAHHDDPARLVSQAPG